MQPKQDQKLEEVRAILQRLQRISAGAEEDETPVVPSPVYSARPGTNGNALVEAAPPSTSPSKEKKLVVAAVPIFAALGLVGTVLWSMTGDETPPERKSQPASEANAPPAMPAEPEKTTAAVAPRAEPAVPERAVPERPAAAPVVAVPSLPPPPANPDAERLAVAQGLMDKGKVTEARRVLNNDLASRHPEAALLLARSFDPNSLQLIANADASPDPAEAERWYRRWSELASGEGLALDRERLDRIIKAMR
jgi:hypothetical protein